MKFKLDENLPASLAHNLSAQEHDAVTVVQQHLSGEPDERIALICNQE